MGKAAVKAQHEELDRVVVLRDGVVDVKSHVKGQIAIGVDGSPGDDCTFEQGLVVRFNDNFNRSSEVQIQTVVSVDGSRKRHGSIGQHLFTVFNINREIGYRCHAQGDLIGANGVAGLS